MAVHGVGTVAPVKLVKGITCACMAERMWQTHVQALGGAAPPAE
jgi:hypothetical protein